MEGHGPAFLLVQLIAHAFGELAELSLGLGIIRIDHEGLKVPQSPTQILKPLALFEISSDLCTDLETQIFFI
jgi:hypothetical protein